MLIESIKKEIDNAAGLISENKETESWFEGLCAKIRITEMNEYKDHIAQIKGKGSVQQAQADAIVNHIFNAICAYA